MHLSNELQKLLDSLNSTVKLSCIYDGTLSSKNSFLHEGKRRFRTEFTSTDNEYSIVLYERSDNSDYENCFARGLFKDINRLALVIDFWVDKQKDILEIKESFEEFELFTDFEFKNSNIEIDQTWRKVKNMFFNDFDFWKNIEWNGRYLEMLIEAKRHKDFENYFPFTSHYWLRFSIDKDIKETWTLDINIAPTFDRQEGDYYVSYCEKPMSGKFFDTPKKALDFYAEKLKEIKPIKWYAQ